MAHLRQRAAHLAEPLIMLIHERYLAREVLLASLLVLASFLGLFGFFDLINELDNLGRGNYGLEHAVMYTVLTMPGRVYETLPIAVLIGGLYALTTLSRHSEITVLRASGVSTARLLRLLARIGLPFVALTFVTGEFIAPPAEKRGPGAQAGSPLAVADQRVPQRLLDQGRKQFRQCRQGHARWQAAEGADIRIRRQARAAVGVGGGGGGLFDRSEGWMLTGVSRTEFSGEGAKVSRHERLAWQSALSPDVMSVMLVVPERMSAWKLWHYIQHLVDNHQETGRYEIALWKKFTYPLACIVMLALALPFAYMHNRNSAVSIKVFTGVMIGVFFHMLNGLFSNLGAINSWPPYAAALTPGLLFLFAAAAMLWWEDRR
jgi:lipopolysaccharide export system permease protein